MRFKMIIFLVVFLALIDFSSSLSATINIPEKYVNVNAGERIYFEIQVKYPENPQRKDLRLTYEIFNIYGELISEAKVLKAIETQASFVDFLIIPDNAESGLYKINVKIKDYQLLNEEVSSTFNVHKGNIEELKIYFFILLASIFFIGFLVILNLRRGKK